MSFLGFAGDLQSSFQSVQNLKSVFDMDALKDKIAAEEKEQEKNLLQQSVAKKRHKLDDEELKISLEQKTQNQANPTGQCAELQAKTIS